MSENIRARIVLDYGRVTTYEYKSLNFRDPISKTIDKTFKISKITNSNDIIISERFHDGLAQTYKNRYPFGNEFEFSLECDPDEIRIGEKTRLYRYQLSGSKSELRDICNTKYDLYDREIVDKYIKIVDRWVMKKKEKRLYSIYNYYTPLFNTSEVREAEASFMSLNEKGDNCR
jgi:hypothetical protein